MSHVLTARSSAPPLVPQTANTVSRLRAKVDLSVRIRELPRLTSIRDRSLLIRKMNNLALQWRKAPLSHQCQMYVLSSVL